MSDPSWKEYFSQPISGYDPVEAQGLSELGYALLHTQIDEQKYLTWARTHFELCSVDVNFFQKHPPPVALVKRLKEVYPWSPEIMPVAEWDGHLIVLAIEKPKIALPAELKPILLLAPVSSLNPYWEFCLQSIEQNPDENLSGEILESDVLEGITLDPPSAVTNLDFSQLRSTPGSQLTQTKVTSNTLISKLEKTVIDPLSPPSTNEISLEVNTAVTSLTTLSKNPSLNPTNNGSKAKPQSPVAITPTSKSRPPDQEPTMIKAEPASVMSVSSETLPNEEKILECLAQYEKIYENRCYLEFNTAKKTAKVSQWPVQSTKITTIPSEVSYEKDNFLKIVATTQKSYHGHIIKSPLIEKLFKEINGGQWPENITLVPILRAGEIVGGIMGWGPKSTYNMNVLREMEKVANELTVSLGFKTQDAA